MGQRVFCSVESKALRAAAGGLRVFHDTHVPGAPSPSCQSSRWHQQLPVGLWQPPHSVSGPAAHPVHSLGQAPSWVPWQHLMGLPGPWWGCSPCAVLPLGSGWIGPESLRQGLGLKCVWVLGVCPTPSAGRRMDGSGRACGAESCVLLRCISLSLRCWE